MIFVLKISYTTWLQRQVEQKEKQDKNLSSSTLQLSLKTAIKTKKLLAYHPP